MSDVPSSSAGSGSIPTQTELPKGMKPCRFCGKPYKPNRPWQKYCNPNCQWNGWLLQKKLTLPADKG